MADSEAVERYITYPQYTTYNGVINSYFTYVINISLKYYGHQKYPKKY